LGLLSKRDAARHVGDELVRLSGYDGVVQCESVHDLVPMGISAWEISVERNPKRKVEEDYTKRSSNPGPLQQSETTFVFVTPRTWAKAEDWASTKRSAQIWGDVKVLWPQHLARWLGQVPWIAAEFSSRYLGLPVRGISSLEMVWEEYANVAAPRKLSGGFVIANRRDECADLQQWLTTRPSNDTGVLVLSAPSEHEAVHFLAASVYALPEPLRTKLSATTFLVSDLAAAEYLGRLDPGHILLAYAGELTPHVLQAKARWGCRVVLIHRTNSRLTPEPARGLSRLLLHAIEQDVLIQSLIEFGYTEDESLFFCTQYGFDYAQLRRHVFLA
jgi:hypothetical protein